MSYPGYPPDADVEAQRQQQAAYYANSPSYTPDHAAAAATPPPGRQPRRNRFNASANASSAAVDDPLAYQQQQHAPPYASQHDMYAQQQPPQPGYLNPADAGGAAGPYGNPDYAVSGATSAGNPFDTPGEYQHVQHDLGQNMYEHGGYAEDEVPLTATQMPSGAAQAAYGASDVDYYGNGNGATQQHLHPDDVPLSHVGGFHPAFVGADGAASDAGTEPSMVRYGKIPQRQPRRYKTLKRVELYHGNLVLDCPVPSKLLEQVPLREDREFTHMRYTAATCDPNDFLEERYTLRQRLYDSPRRTELCIAMTMYNEDAVLFCRTMYKVMENIRHLCRRDRSRIWGSEGWKKVAVCIISDGRDKISSRVLSVLAAMGVYQEGVAKNVVAGKPVTAHIYEYTAQLAIDPDMNFKSAERGFVPVQIIFCLKEKNAQKINSHRWFFNAFGPVLDPHICALLDVGTAPGPTSIYHLWKTFDNNSNVAGACGEIVAMKGKFFRNLLNPLVAAQNFEYKMSNILDKPLESVFGYITVLPGAFSAYRYHAIQNDPSGEGPLKEYFKGETLHHSVDADLWTKNMYLAEDRVLCWELVSKRRSNYVLHYVRSSYAETDVPDGVAELISQRRRWLNGSFFAAIHATVHFGYIHRSKHGIWRKFWLHIELVYQVFTMTFAWLALANWYITFRILTNSIADPSFGIEDIRYFNIALDYYYLALLITCFLLAMGNRPAGTRFMYTWMMISFAIITVYMLFCAGYITAQGIINVKEAEQANGSFDLADVFTNPIFRNIVLSLIATYGLWLLASLIALDPAHMLTSFAQYLLLAPSFINVINVYAFCNVHDLTWGTKGADKKVQTDLGIVKSEGGAAEVAVPTEQNDINAAYDDACALLATEPDNEKKPVNEEERITDSYRAIRTNVVIAWVISNGALAAGILSSSAGGNIATSGSNAVVNGYMIFLLYSVAGLAFIKFCGCLIYTIMFMFQR